MVIHPLRRRSNASSGRTDRFFSERKYGFSSGERIEKMNGEKAALFLYFMQWQSETKGYTTFFTVFSPYYAFVSLDNAAADGEP